MHHAIVQTVENPNNRLYRSSEQFVGQPVSDHTQSYVTLLESLPWPRLANDQILSTFSFIHIPRNSTFNSDNLR